MMKNAEYKEKQRKENQKILDEAREIYAEIMALGE